MKQLVFLLVMAMPCVLNGFHVEDKTSLMDAAQKADLVTMQKLIAGGADVNAIAWRDQPHGGRPVLRFAIDSGSYEAVKMLLDAGATPHEFTESPIITDHKDSNQRNLSLLCHAINSQASIDIIALLIDRGAVLDGSPKIAGDWSPLMIAALRGYAEAVKVLLEAGADLSVKHKQSGKTALDYAQEQGHAECIKLLKGN